MSKQNAIMWICCQLGAREHYAIPRALQDNCQLIGLFTDAWVPPGSLASRLPSTYLRGRFHPSLAEASVYHSTAELIYFELTQKFQERSPWNLIIERNRWFQKRVIKQLKLMAPRLSQLKSPPIVFAYSYAALEILKYAKTQNWIVVLGQIDPGIVEERIVSQLYQAAEMPLDRWQEAPQSYWHSWQQECEIADYIIVNSTWSKEALMQCGANAKKIKTFPLAYQLSEKFIAFERTYPNVFTQARPLRLLFLGQVNLRKGILPLLKAIEALRGQPIELFVVGPIQIEVPSEYLSHPQIRWVGGVARGFAADYYRQADLFILPTYSDGFALTQLEAMAWKLPLIVSPYCGEVVKHRINGLILSEVDPVAITQALRLCLNSPQMLSDMSSQTQLTDFSLGTLRECLDKLSIPDE